MKLKPNFSNRRKNFQIKMSKNSIAIFLSAHVKNRNADVDFRYRQSSDLYYLTGINEEQCALVITNNKCILYLRERDAKMEIWNGYRLGVKRACEQTGIKKTFSINKFYNHLPNLLKNKTKLYYNTGLNTKYDKIVLPLLYKNFINSRKGNFAPGTIIQPASILSEMRLFKTKYEIELLKKSAKITAKAHKSIMQKSRPGMYAYEIEAEIIHTFRKYNAWEAYPSIVAPGKEACILHYTQNDARLNKNELLLVDAGAELDFMATDVTRTFPINKKFSSPARDLYEVVLKAQTEAIKASTKGNTLANIHKRTIKNLTRGLMDLKILSSNLDENLEKEKWKPYYMHQTSHWLGMDVHDVGDYNTKEKKPRKLENGMVFTIEPGLYISKNNKKVSKHFRGIGIRIEDNILIQNNKPYNLTNNIPKKISDIEAQKSV